MAGMMTAVLVAIVGLWNWAREAPSKVPGRETLMRSEQTRCRIQKGAEAPEI